MPVIPNDFRGFAPPNSIGIPGGFTGLVGTSFAVPATGSPTKVQLVKWSADDGHSQQLVIALSQSAGLGISFTVEWGAEGASFSETYSGPLGAFSSPAQWIVPVRGAWVRVTANILSVSNAGIISAFASQGRTERANTLVLVGDVAPGVTSGSIPRSNGSIPASAARFRVQRSGGVSFRIDVPNISPPFANTDILTVPTGAEMAWLECGWIDAFTITNLDPAVTSSMIVLFELST